MSNVNPEDINAFAGMLGKLNKIQEGRKVVDTAAGRADRLAKNDMTAILSAFAETSGTKSALSLTPETISEDISKTQKSVKQVGAEFQPKDISPVLGKPEKEHPMAGMLVGEDQEPGDEETWDGVSPDTEEFLDDINEEESIAKEDSLNSIKKRLGDYLQDIKSGKKLDDKDLADKKKIEADKLGPAIKTFKTDDGKEIKIHGNEDDGFRLKVNEKMHSAKFKSFDEAQMACEAYAAKRKSAMENQDYVEEK